MGQKVQLLIKSISNVRWSTNAEADYDPTFGPAAYVMAKAEAGSSHLQNKTGLSPSSIPVFYSFQLKPLMWVFMQLNKA